MKSPDPLRQHLINLLTKAEAHVDLESSLKNFPRKLRGAKPDGAPHTPWQLLEHIRIAQWDILEFSRNADHLSPEFPKGYWPKPDQLGTPELWQETIEKFNHDLTEMVGLVANSETDLYAKIPHGEGQTILREALLIADHNAYHLGALAVIARLLKA